MYTITAVNVNDALWKALENLKVFGQEEQSRNGPVLVFPEPVCTTYDRCTERVLFSPLRDANPFFHMAEALWMLDGRNDLEFLTYYNKNMASFSDDGKTLHGAYGFRWRNWFEHDQLPILVKELQEHPDSRRAVLAMWDAANLEDWGRNGDLQMLQKGGKDIPCNTHIYFDRRGGKLNMTVCNRSNDMLWGAYGANAVHFSILLEVLAAWIGVPVGVYRQFSNNLHLYVDAFPRWKELISDVQTANLYESENLSATPMVNVDIAQWFRELRLVLSDDRFTAEYREPFFSTIVLPMFAAWQARKHQVSFARQMEYAGNIAAPDWHEACIAWLQRHEAQRLSKATESMEVRPQ